MKKLFPLLALFAVGCSSSYVPDAPPETIKVNGKVLSPSGSPLTGGRVVFKPKDPTKQEAAGDIQPNGTFSLTSFRKDDGATPGDYVVVIEKVTYKTGSATPVNINIPTKYQSEKTSDLLVTVKEGQNDYTVRLK